MDPRELNPRSQCAHLFPLFYFKMYLFEPQREIFHSVCSPKWQQWSRLGLARARSLELHPGFPRVAEPKAHGRELGGNRAAETSTSTHTDARAPGSCPTCRAMTPAPLLCSEGPITGLGACPGPDPISLPAGSWQFPYIRSFRPQSRSGHHNETAAHAER